MFSSQDNSARGFTRISPDGKNEMPRCGSHLSKTAAVEYMLYILSIFTGERARNKLMQAKFIFTLGSFFLRGVFFYLFIYYIKFFMFVEVINAYSACVFNKNDTNWSFYPSFSESAS